MVGSCGGMVRSTLPTARSSLPARDLATVEELQGFVAQGLNEVVAPNVATDLASWEGLDLTRPTPTSPAALATIAVPVLVLRGERTLRSTWMERGTRHIAEHVRNAEVRTVPGAGHAATRMVPEALAAELVRFVDTPREPAPQP